MPTFPMPRLLASLLALAALACAAALWAVHDYRSAPLRLESSPVRVTIPKGAGARAVAAALEREGIGVSAERFVLAFRLRGDDDRIKAGTYRFESPLTLRALMDKLVAGDVWLTEIRFIEGWTFRQMREAVAAHPDLAKDSVPMSDAAILQAIGAPERHPEGLFFPNTYRFTPGASDLEVWRQAYQLMQRTLQAAWEARAPNLPYRDPYQALVIASIIEKETGASHERDRISAVFANRLRIGMPLQSDPTTIYGMGAAFDGNLRKRDLQTDTPYNTYTRRGLPPTPIAAPGRESIVAALNPAAIDALYFVARGDGTSEFSRDLAAHNRAVARYQLKRQ